MTTSARIDFPVPTEHACYEGHFPGNPIVPGALLLQWISGYSSEAFSRRITGVKHMKFLIPVQPGDHCVVELNLVKVSDICADVAIKVVCSCGPNVICKGTLLSGSALVSAS
ncbi:hypothetical protein MNBD_GAMMA17-1648 [hydrothermal vent metagenome]|uniref:ApeI dehydratase-like domain-containing protein n=1 Tax=hydrothermal vent metagenome TaxID=652676 RepID=A0A3B0ZRZ6_9ZZZZ